MNANSHPYFNERLGASVPRDMYEATLTAALRQKMTVADYLRLAVSNRLTADGISHPSLPPLRRTTFAHRGGL